MLEDFHKKNYYMLQTLLKEIENYNIISFDAFDTLLLRDLLYTTDIFKLLGKFAEEQMQISGFEYLRANEESNLRQNTGQEEVTIDDIYNSIENKLHCDCSKLKAQEITLEKEHIFLNPLIKQVFDVALQKHKKVWIISDIYFSKKVMLDILQQVHITDYDNLFLSSEIGKTKYSGNLYRYILEKEKVKPEKWLHIGDHLDSDAKMPRMLGITAFHYISLREKYFINKEQEYQEREFIEGHPIERDKEVYTIEKSVKVATQINRFYTQVVEPDPNVAVHVADVSMMFNMSSEKVDNLKEYVIKLLKRQLMFQEFWALKNISFDVYKGEKVGLVGLNGSGKSTILKIISGVLKPTTGKVEVQGSIAPLIELGAGFDMDLSARENIYLNGAILGYSRENMAHHYSEIIHFSELEEFEDVPIKNFSSGMVARLGFAIATCHVPDILIIDEILSVGDFEFQKKCHCKMKELTEKGATVLFVSHSANDIVEMCDKVVWLEHGKLIDMGESQYIVDKYLNR